MRRMPIGAIFLAVLLLSGCASMDKYKDEPTDVLYKADIDGDDAKEIIRVKDKFDAQSETIVAALKKSKIPIATFSVPGRLENIEFMQMGIGPREYVSMHYKNRDDSETLSIYSFEKKKFNKIFTIDSNCGIKTDYSSILARVKVGKFKCDGDVCSCIAPVDGDVWIWGGDRFVQER